MLTGADAKRAEELGQKIDELRQAGKYAEAQQAARRILDLRKRVQGTDHWETADARRLLQTLEKISALPADAQAELTEDAKRDGQVFQLFQQGRYADAVPLLKRSVAVRRRHLGEEHSETLKAVNDLAFFLSKSGRYAEAEPLFRKALAIRRKVLGEEHPDTAQSHSAAALNLIDLGRYAEAEPLDRQALAIQRKVWGEDHPETAQGYNSLAFDLNVQGQYAAAEPLFRQALAIRRKRLGEDHPDTAGSYNNVAANLDAQGKYAAAEPLYRQALTVWRKVRGEKHPDTAASYNNLAFNLHAQGRYAEAEPLYRQALAINRDVWGEKHVNTATSLNNLALNLHAQGKYAQAEVLARQALALRRQILREEHPHTASSYNNLALILHAQGKMAEVESYYRRALAIQRQVLGDDHPDTAHGYGNLAGILNDQGKYTAAEPFCRRALALCRKLLGDEHPVTATSCVTLAFNLNGQGQYAAAEKLLQESLAIYLKTLGEEHPDTVSGYSHLAANLNAQGKYAEAEKLWRKAAKGFEAARLAVSFAGLERAPLAAARSPLPHLAACLARAGKAADAGTAWEAGLARGLFDDLSGQLARPLSAKERQRQQDLIGRLQLLDKQLASLNQPRERTDTHRQQLDQLKQQREAAVAALTQFEAELAHTYGPAAGQVYDRARIQAQLPADAALLSWLDIPGQPRAADPTGEHWACILRQRGDSVWVKLPGSGPKEAWTQEDDKLPGLVRELLVTRPSDVTVQWRERAGRLYTQRLAPLARHLGATGDLPAVRHLIILPSPALAGVPVEALVEARTDQQPAYTVSYAPSGTVFAWLQENRKATVAKSKKPDSPRLLAVGDPVFARPGGSAPSPPPLPGSRREVLAIARLFDHADKLLGSEASEQQLERLATSGRLRDYRYLHVATHGLLDPKSPLSSALLLAQDELPDPLQQVLAGKRAYDGRLTAAQILRTWKLDAELVTLSACETGLGQYQGGEGYVGFAQALFVVGARGLVLSQWPVDDNATALLMSRFYQNLLSKRKGLDKPLAKAEALEEAKAWLRGLNADQVERRLDELSRGAPRPRPATPVPAAVHPYGHPYYWAAFILVGDPQ
jgi:CHAT domain-containing protein/Tfp pilus assembly protein PilF